MDSRLTIDEFCQRVYTGRRNLQAAAVNPDLSGIRVLVSHEDFAALVIEARRTLMAPWLYLDGAGGWRVFGMPLEPSSDLTSGQIRFRSEVEL